MTCLSAEELAAVYDGVLPADQAARARRHLAVCDRCANEIRCLDEMLSAADQAQAPPPEALRRLVAALDQPRSGPAPGAPAAADSRPLPNPQASDK